MASDSDNLLFSQPLRAARPILESGQQFPQNRSARSKFSWGLFLEFNVQSLARLQEQASSRVTS